MKLLRKTTNEWLPASISALIEKDYLSIQKNPVFEFNWTTERQHEVYKIYLLSDKETILGLMSLVNRPEEYRIHLNLLEVSKVQQGRNKDIDFIAGCLIAFAASLAVKRGYHGFVSLDPKTTLIDLYQNKYGFRQYGRYLAIEGLASQLLIDKYLNDEKGGTDL